jgi:hypothetical protein
LPLQIDQKLAEELLHAELENLGAMVAQHKELLEEKLVEEVGGSHMYCLTVPNACTAVCTTVCRARTALPLGHLSFAVQLYVPHCTTAYKIRLCFDSGGGGDLFGNALDIRNLMCSCGC